MQSPIITGHQHFQPSALPAPLEFDLGPGDAEFVAKFATAIDALRAKNAAESSKAKSEASA